MATSKYHRLQATNLLELAALTTDVLTAAALRGLAADHTELAVAPDGGNGKPRSDQVD